MLIDEMHPWSFFNCDVEVLRQCYHFGIGSAVLGRDFRKGHVVCAWFEDLNGDVVPVCRNGLFILNLASSVEVRSFGKIECRAARYQKY